MQHSEKIEELSKALATFQEKVGNIVKDSTNPFFKSKYASLENVVTTIRPHLAAAGLSFSQFPDDDGLTTILMHSSGQWMSAHTKLVIKDPTPQGHGSAITYLRRYALSAVLGIATEDDDDGNTASAPQKPAERTPARPAAKPAAPATKPQPPKSIEQQRLAKKKLIAKLCNEIALMPLETPEEYAHYVLEVTGLSLEEHNYDAIIKQLEALPKN